MCDFLSFFIHNRAATLPRSKRYLFGDLRSHSATMRLHSLRYGAPDVWREAEWTGEEPDSLAIRANGDSSALRATVLADFPSRSDLLLHAAGRLPAALTTLDLSGVAVPKKLALPPGLTRLDLRGARVPEKLALPAKCEVLR